MVVDSFTGVFGEAIALLATVEVKIKNLQKSGLN